MYSHLCTFRRCCIISTKFLPSIGSQMQKSMMLLCMLQVVVSLRSLLQDRMAALNGRTVEYVLKQDKPAFIRLIGLSVAQVCPPTRPVTMGIRTLKADISSSGVYRLAHALIPHWSLASDRPCRCSDGMILSCTSIHKFKMQPTPASLFGQP